MSLQETFIGRMPSHFINSIFFKVAEHTFCVLFGFSSDVRERNVKKSVKHGMTITLTVLFGIREIAECKLNENIMVWCKQKLDCLSM